MFEGFQSTFQKIVKKNGMQKPLEAADVCRKFRIFLEEIWPDATEFVKVQSFRDGTLTLKVAGSGWKQEVMMRSREWLREFNMKLEARGERPEVRGQGSKVRVRNLEVRS